jgi:molecular chaperone DnaJ
VAVRVRSHAFYRQEGDVLVCEVPVTMTEAALGAEIDVPLLDGQVRMRVPPGTQSGAVFRIRGKGLPKGGVRGDAHVRLVVEVPAAVPEGTRGLVEQLASALGDAAYPKRQAFREASRQEQSPEPAAERKSG